MAFNIEVTRETDDGVQVEVEGASLMLTVRGSEHYGLKGSLAFLHENGDVLVVSFHGDAERGWLIHPPQPLGKGEENDEHSE